MAPVSGDFEAGVPLGSGAEHWAHSWRHGQHSILVSLAPNRLLVASQRPRLHRMPIGRRPGAFRWRRRFSPNLQASPEPAYSRSTSRNWCCRPCCTAGSVRRVNSVTQPGQLLSPEASHLPPDCPRPLSGLRPRPALSEIRKGASISRSDSRVWLPGTLVQTGPQNVVTAASPDSPTPMREDWATPRSDSRAGAAVSVDFRDPKST